MDRAVFWLSIHESSLYYFIKKKTDRIATPKRGFKNDWTPTLPFPCNKQVLQEEPLTRTWFRLPEQPLPEFSAASQRAVRLVLTSHKICSLAQTNWMFKKKKAFFSYPSLERKRKTQEDNRGNDFSFEMAMVMVTMFLRFKHSPINRISDHENPFLFQKTRTLEWVAVPFITKSSRISRLW